MLMDQWGTFWTTGEIDVLCDWLKRAWPIKRLGCICHQFRATNPVDRPPKGQADDRCYRLENAENGQCLLFMGSVALNRDGSCKNTVMESFFWP